MPDPPDRELSVFSAARRLQAGQRAAYLDEACAGDAALRRRVEQLLQAGDEAGGFLEGPALVLPRPAASTLISAEKTGDRIGRYKLLQQIGEGGCGVVYMAEQEQPVRRRVALKVIKLGMDTKSVIARFEAERQALALMDHPNIAKVLDAGATDTGRPYFVMELVRGIKVTNYCDQNNLSTRERLDLFIQICRAIQHAHQKGIIHRDIKPSNILVTMNDGAALPKVIDFGIAKATHGKLTDQTYFTAFEQFIGTPAYMSPEQAEMSALDIDTRSDIYSLGVLLYELLTGQTPFDSRKLFQAGLDEIRRTIREQEPVRPSTRLSTMLQGELTTTARQRRTEPPKLVHLIRGDLDWIVMKALEKDRTRRYETASDLAADIQRHLGNDPVAARPPSNLYRFQKLVRRNKLAFISAIIVTTALVVGLGVSTWSLFKEEQARRQAQADRIKAQTEAAKSQQVAHFLQAMLEGVGPEVALGRDTTMLRDIMEDTRHRLESELRNQPAVEVELRTTIANTYLQLGDYPDAETEYSRALRLQGGISGKDSTNVIQLGDSLAETMINRGELSAAEPLIREDLALSQKFFGSVHPAVATALHSLAVVRWRRGDLVGADELLRQSLAQYREFQEAKGVSVSLNDIGMVRLDSGDLAGAEASFRESLDIRTKLLPPGHPALAMARNNLALALWYRGDLAGAEEIYRQTVGMDRKLYHDGTPDSAAALNNLALVLRDRGDFAAAEPLQRAALAMIEKIMGRDGAYTANARNNLATLLRRHGAMAADAGILREALKLNPADSMTADALANLLEIPHLTPAVSGVKTASSGWRWTSAEPAPNWAESGFSDAHWQSSQVLRGAATYTPRSPKNPVNSHTNLWLRREFELSGIPPGNLVFSINRNHDAQIFLNGAEVVPKVDWSDSGVQLSPAGAGKAALLAGRNVLAVHCEDADAGAPIDVQIFASQDPNVGRRKVIEELDALIGSEPERAQLYMGRATMFARLGQWREAAKDLSKVIELDPSKSENWYPLAPLLLEMNDQPGYDRYRHQALARFATTSDPVVAGRIAALSLLAPAPLDDLTNAAKLADDAAKAEYADGYLALRQLAGGLAAYRQGQFSNSVVWMEKAIATCGQKSMPGWTHELERDRKATAYFIEAMAHYQLRDTAAARAALNKALEIVQTQLPASGSADVGRDWPGWLTTRILQREAQAQMQSP